MPVTANNFSVQDFAFPVVSGASCDYPAVGDVQQGVSYDSGAQVGTLVLPGTGDVESGVGYGAGGTEFTGTLECVSTGEPSTSYTCHSPADVVRRVLIGMGLGVDPPSTPWPVRVDLEPHSPEECITVYDTTPQDDGRNQISGERWQHEGIQVRVRARDFPMCWDKACAVKEAMDEDASEEIVTLDGVRYLLHSFSKVSGPIRLGRDKPATGRAIVTINALVTIRKLS